MATASTSTQQRHDSEWNKPLFVSRDDKNRIDEILKKKKKMKERFRKASLSSHDCSRVANY